MYGNQYRDQPGARMDSSMDLREYYDHGAGGGASTNQPYSSVPNDSTANISGYGGGQQQGYQSNNGGGQYGQNNGGGHGGDAYGAGGYGASAGAAGGYGAAAAGGYGASNAGGYGASTGGGGGGYGASGAGGYGGGDRHSGFGDQNDSWRGGGATGAVAAGKSSKKKWFIIGGVILLLAIGGIVAGVLVSRNNDSDSSSSGGSSASNFAKDPKLHKAFYGMAYTPELSMYPACGNSIEEVVKDMQMISQLTNKIRLYGADCDQSALVLEAIKRTKIDMEVWLGNYVMPGEDEAYARQRDAIQAAIKKYGTKHIGGITVGNEYMLNYLTSQGLSSPDINTAAGDVGAATLIRYIDDTRTNIEAMKLDKTIPIGNSDAGSFFNNLVLAKIDYGLSNVHPWFANTTIEAAPQWTWDFFDEQNVTPATAINPNIEMYIAETGWPSGSKDVANESNGFASASVADLQTFLDLFVCKSNDDGVKYFYFEMFDEEWKDLQFGGVEGHWGLFDKHRKMKNLKLPTCLLKS